MSTISELAMDVASIPGLEKLPMKLIKLDEQQMKGPERDAETIEIDFGTVVVKIFRMNCPYLFTREGLKAGWHFRLTTCGHDGSPAGPLLVAENVAIDQIIHYIRDRASEHGFLKPKETEA